jgi:diguanylate cyclase (GGDEF)-like protein/PAS domain S-box-containing protein
MFALTRKDAARMLGVALLYFLSAKLGLMLALVGKSVTLFWPASGIALTALLVYGVRLWPAVLLGAVLGNIAEGWLPALEISIGATLEAVAGACVLRRIPGFNLSLPTIRDIFALLLTAAGCALFSALNGPFWLALNGIMPWAVYPGAALFWWMGDALGIVLFTPLLLAWLRHQPTPDTAAIRREEVAYFASLFLLCFVVFSSFGEWLFHTKVGPFILLPAIVWGALRFNMRLTALGCVMVFFFSMVGMVCDIGAFAPVTPESIREVWIYNLVMGVTGLILAVSNYQRGRINMSLELSRADLQRAQEVAQTGSWNLDISGNELRWSDETYRIFGVPSGSALTLQSFLECVHPDDREFVAGSWQAALRGKPYDIEHRILADGKVKWVQEKAQVDFGKDGQAVAAIGTVRDITALREAEKRLHLSAKVFDNSGEGILITDAGVRIIAANSAFAEMSGYSEAELLGQNPRMFASGLHKPDYFREMWDAINRTGRWQGEIWDRHKSGRLFPKWMSINAVRDEAGELTHYVAISNDITERKEAEKHIHLLAYYDVLTGLPNRTLLHDRLEQLVAVSHRGKHKFALLFLDLDRFKYVNDSMGHATGDKLLQTVAQRLLECVREGDTVSRIGGDEFVVLLRETDAKGAAHVATKILDSLAVAHDIGGQQISTYASIGISVYPDHAEDADTLVKHADVAMYHAKDEGRNNYQFFAPEMNYHANRLFSMEKDLRLALERDEFSLHYQPQVDLGSGRVCGAEALLRWKHPDKGYISPAEFIPVAEETGQIIPIGEWVLRSACAQLAEWRRQGMAAFPVAVNLSIRQLRQPALAQRVAEVLEETGLHPHDLELELTEGIMMGDTEAAMVFLAQMHELGVRLSIDDFGTGFSSLSYLKKLPLDRLKVDQTFVRDIETDESDAAIVRSIISLGHRLKMRVIAEGVETLEQLDFLRVRGCDEIQGYYFSRPLPAEEFARFIGSNPKLDEGVALAVA